MGNTLRPFERQLNLLGALLKARDGLAWADIEKIEGYHDSLPQRSRQKRFERDLDELRAAGLVVQRDLLDGARSCYRMDRAACLMPPLNLRPEQRHLLFRIGMAYLADGGAGPLKAHLQSALLKVQAGAGREGLPAVVPPALIQRSLRRKPAEEARLEEIGKALLARHLVRFGYQAAAGGKAQSRRVAPYGLVSRRGGWYLVGHDEDKRAVRTFRLSRIRGEVRQDDPGFAGAQYEVPGDFDPEVYFSSAAFGAGEDAFQEVRVWFDSEVAFIVQNDFGGVYRVDERADGSVVLHLPQAYPGELLRYLCEFAGHWKVEKPDGLRAHVLRTLRGALRGARA